MLDILRTFIDLNRDLIFFVYGLSFFILGLAITLQSRQSSRLDLARALTWLGAFGFAHGFHEWGEYFIPIQAAYLSESTVAGLHALRLLLLALSYSFLLEFGARLIRPDRRSQIITRANLVLSTAWLLVTFLVLRTIYQSPDWFNIGDALARYFIGFPGGLVAGYALRQHTMERIAPLDLPNIVRSLRIVGLSLAGYAFLGGLIPPPVPFFPGNFLNTASFESALIIPPSILRSTLGLIIAIFMIRALEVFDVEINRRIEDMEQAQLLQVEHQRIARQLHDGAIQKVYTSGLLVQSLENHLQDTEIAEARFDRAVNALNDAILDLRSSLRELSPSPSSEDLVDRLEELTRDPRIRSFLDVSLETELPEQPVTDPLRIEHVVAITSEALTNAVRHAQADRVWIQARLLDSELQITVEDNGVGIANTAPGGFGIRNMRDRARLLEGRLEINQRPEGGTSVKLQVPAEASS
ncbi:MAG: sensor histidine kinase [Anaerolineales bacterium]